MKKNLSLLSFVFFGLSPAAFASHGIGAEISYHQVSVNNYQITFKYYRDCSGQQTGNTAIVNLKAPGCNAGRNITVNMVSRKIMKPYGPVIPIVCSTTGHPNAELITYTGMVTFSAAEAACPDWVMSWSECCRSSTGNLVGQSDLYTETKLVLAPGLVNNSPAFDTLHAPVMYVGLGLPYNLSLAAVDPDGDSLVYSLATPLTAANVPAPYRPYPAPAAGNYIVNPSPMPPYSTPFNPQLAQLAGGSPTTYSPTFPMPSIYVNWSGPPTLPVPDPSVPGGVRMIWEATNLFKLNPVNGELKFAPSRYVPTNVFENKYVFSVMVDEYRKVNGVMTKLGSIRRETQLVVIDAATHLPEMIGMTANGQTLTPGYEIQLRPGATLNLQFAALDPETSDTVQATTNGTYILPGATFSSTPGNPLTGSLSWTPTAAHVRWQPYYFQIMLRDNANPLRGIRTETIAVRVNATGGVTGLPEDQFRNASFTAYPNPFSEELNFSLNLKTKAESILIYNLLGQQVDEIPLKTVGLGAQKVPWENAGKHAAGTYVARLIAAGKTVQTIKFTKLQ